MSTAKAILSFDLVEDICLAVREDAKLASRLPQTEAPFLGPLLELRQSQRPLVSNEAWLAFGSFADLLKNIKLRPGFWFEPISGNQGFATLQRLSNDALCWPDMVVKAKRAAVRAGFTNEHATKLIAAIGELYSNAVEHSNCDGLGYVVFAADRGIFEFVVADAGIGVLESLRSSPNYKSLDDAGAALELALQSGVSRHLEPGRGNGFQPIFVGLANISRTIRFRSGNYARVIENSQKQISAMTRQISPLRGLFCSVLCHC